MVTSDILASAMLKVKRAERHIDEIRAISDPLSRDFYVIKRREYGRGVDREPAYTDLIYKPIQPVAQHFALIVGDAVHNLRSALDHLATAIARTKNASAEIHFPMCKLRQDLLAAHLSKSGQQKALAAIEDALPGAKELFFKEIRSENGPDEHLWAFNVLDNTDKHNLLIPSVAVTAIEGLSGYSSNRNMFSNINVDFDANYEHVILRVSGGLFIHNDFKTSVNVRFGQVCGFENEAVLPTLMQIRDVVFKTINRFAVYINTGS